MSPPAPKVTEVCVSMSDLVCVRRGGKLDVAHAFLVIVDGDPKLLCADCHALLVKRREEAHAR
jgi:hypothetical protein